MVRFVVTYNNGIAATHSKSFNADKFTWHIADGLVAVSRIDPSQNVFVVPVKRLISLEDGIEA